MIYDISPTEVPLMSNATRGKATQKFFQWQTDVLEGATAANYVLEGDSATVDTATATVLLANYCQISDKVASVSGSQEATDSYGRKSEMAYQIAKRGRELKRDIEKRICSGNASDDGSALTARQTAGLACFAWTNQVKSAGATASIVTVASGAPATSVVSSTVLTNGTLTSSDLKSALSKCWDQGGDPNMVLVGSHNKQLISGFAGIATQYRENPQVGPATIIGAADVYVGDFNTVNIVPSRFTPANGVHVIDTSTIEVKYLRPISMWDLAKNGDSDQKQILAEYGLCVKSPSANSYIHTTTTS